MSDRKRIVGTVGGDDQIMSALRAFGLEPKAPPRSGRCMSCGRNLRPDEDHSVCDDCFPEDLKEQWKETDPRGGPGYVRLDLDTGDLSVIPDPTEETEREPEREEP